MPERDEKEAFRNRDVSFIGLVLACTGDDIRNRLAHVEESAARVRNLLEEEGDVSNENHNSPADILSTIDRQLKLLGQKIHYLSRFAKRMDKRFCIFDPGQILEEAVSFSTRFARMKSVSLVYEPRRTLPTLSSDPLAVHFLVSTLIKDMVKRVQKGGAVSVRTQPENRGLMIDISGRGSFKASGTGLPQAGDEDPYRAAVDRMLGPLGGHLETSEPGANVRKASLLLHSKGA